MAITRNGFINSALTGGATGALDAKLSTDIVGVAFAITVASGVAYLHYYNSASAAAESSPDVIKPDNLGVGDAGRWLLIDVWTGLAALDAIGALTPAANKIPQFTSATAATALEITANTFPARSSAGNIAAKAITDFALSLLDDTTAAAFKTTSLAAGDIVQIVNTQTGAVATGTTAMVNDDTIPQKTEGDEYMTLAITPTSATNKLIIMALVNIANSNSVAVITALFQDATADALAAVQNYPGAADAMMNIQLSYYMTAGTTSATTFKIRAGGTTGATSTFNGATGGRKFGAMCISSITIIEVQV